MVVPTSIVYSFYGISTSWIMDPCQRRLFSNLQSQSAPRNFHHSRGGRDLLAKHLAGALPMSPCALIICHLYIKRYISTVQVENRIEKAASQELNPWQLAIALKQMVDESTLYTSAISDHEIYLFPYPVSLLLGLRGIITTRLLVSSTTGCRSCQAFPER